MKSFFQSFYYAWNGLSKAVTEERNIRVQSVVAVLVIAAGFYFQVTLGEWCMLLLCIALVIGFELLNTALENLTDLVKPEHHPIAGKVKDIGAGAVLFVSILSAIIGLIIFWKYL